MKTTSVTIMGRHAPNIEYPFFLYISIIFWLYIFWSFWYCFCSFSSCGRIFSIFRLFLRMDALE